ncbi:MAG: PIG-L family deacetylase [Saprospiraceae bacterium]|nr:PIG-L family deacetylase [Saprospiraceae bacterium]
MENQSRKLMAIVAHPDDESLGLGGTLAKYAAEGAEVSVLMATKGERGRFGTAAVSPGMEVVGKTRGQELLEAAKVLGIKQVRFLGYIDGDLDQAPAKQIIEEIALHIRDLQPAVVLSFGPEGAYGHPDHIAISQFTTAAILKAADAGFDPISSLPHTVLKLYNILWSKPIWDVYQAAFKELSTTVDGKKRLAFPYPEWMITTQLNTEQYWETAWAAIQCHQTQMAIYQNLDQLTPAQHKVLWGRQEFYRVFSLVNGGRKKERDLFEGITAAVLVPN